MTALAGEWTVPSALDSQPSSWEASALSVVT